MTPHSPSPATIAVLQQSAPSPTPRTPTTQADPRAPDHRLPMPTTQTDPRTPITAPDARHPDRLPHPDHRLPMPATQSARAPDAATQTDPRAPDHCLPMPATQSGPGRRSLADLGGSGGRTCAPS
ncbi:hypothetical protein Sme01_59930 [Sphaerisporangium melleum]|uniref:Uncharacterized protein n=1 Tax=Sphaerisporangium melleum TaxID=321316 RepID=A0A917RBG2_9ACTN|nr:hypothetical protein GCM10007964_46120 [Sphaerisporangium melleum]GII73517.1 hypothetical protein Sme01_59930 [Sphaerisporangium melleum]